MNALLTLDGNLLLWIQEYLRNDFLTPIMTFITRLGDAGIIWIAISVLLLFFKKTRPIGLMAFLALMGSVVINNLILKHLVARIRPYEVVDGLTLLIEKQNDFSFPSGHSGASLAASVVFLKKAPKKFGIPALILALLICFSRLYVGVHYPTDVLAGICTGTLSACISMFLYGKCCSMAKIDPDTLKKLPAPAPAESSEDSPEEKEI